MHPGIQSLMILGCGYVGEHVGRACVRHGIKVFGVTRSPGRAEELAQAGIEPIVVARPTEVPEVFFRRIDALLDSIPLERTDNGLKAGQPEWVPQLAENLGHLKWAGYLSTTGVYGDAQGGWVDESTPCHPKGIRGRERLKAEKAWQDALPQAEVFRLAGIYGPGRNIVSRLKEGNYKVVAWDPPHWSNRIHVEDIVAALLAAMRHPRPGRIMNLADDEPLPHAEYAIELARLVGAPPPIVLTPEEATEHLSAAALEFFSDSKRVSNRLLHEELLPQLKYPSFRQAFAKGGQ